MSPRVIVRGSVEHRVWQVLGWLCVLAVAVYVLGPGKDYLVLRWAQAVTLAIAILGLNLVTGYSGQVSLGHSAFFGIGAYTTMILVADHGWPFLATLPVAGAIGFAIGALVGLPALRIRDLYLTLVTLGIALAFPSIVKKMESLTGGGNGKTITVGKGDVPNGFRWRAPSWVPGHLAGQRLDLRHRLRHRHRDVPPGVEPRAQPRRAGHGRHAGQRDRSHLLGRQQLPRQGDGLRRQRLLDVRRRWLLRPRRPDHRPRQLRAPAIDRAHRRPRHRRDRHDHRPRARRRDRRVPALPLLQRLPRSGGLRAVRADPHRAGLLHARRDRGRSSPPEGQGGARRAPAARRARAVPDRGRLRRRPREVR